MAELMSAFYNVLLPIVLTSVFGYFVWWMQRRSRTTPLESLINEIQEERTELKSEREKLKAELRQITADHKKELEGIAQTRRSELESFERDKADLLARIRALEKDRMEERRAHERDRESWRIREASLVATINGLNDRLTELDSKLRAVKRSTDELKKQTGDLNAGKV